MKDFYKIKINTAKYKPIRSIFSLNANMAIKSFTFIENRVAPTDLNFYKMSS
jgi:hypothetical protein